MKWFVAKRFIVSIVISATALGIAAQPAAARQPVGGCSNDGYDLVKVGKDPVNISVDKNGDGWVCEKLLPNGVNYNVIDNGSNH